MVPNSTEEASLLLAIRQLSAELRQRSMAGVQETSPTVNAMDRPEVFFEESPEGSYPIIALRTRPCSHFASGFCTPCGYSRGTQGIKLDGAAVSDAIESQMDWLMRHFFDLFESGTGAPRAGVTARPPGGREYSLELAGQGSFFCDAEVPRPHRLSILERLARLQEQQDVHIHVMLETRPEHLIAADQSGELSQLRPLLRQLDAVVNMGLEHRDDFLRNVVYAKGLELTDFEEAVRIAKRNALVPGGFVFSDSFILTPGEALRETTRSIDYCQGLDLFVNAMAPNIQPYTVPAVLFEFGRYTLPEPFFLLDLAETLLAHLPSAEGSDSSFDWFLGGLVSSPRPQTTILANPRKRTPDAIAAEIYYAVMHLSAHRDVVEFRRRTNDLRRGPEYEYYRSTLLLSDRRSWPDRLREAIGFVQTVIEEYDARACRASGTDLAGDSSHDSLRDRFSRCCAAVV